MLYNNDFDKLIEEVLKDEMQECDIEISEEEIEREWQKLLTKRKKKAYKHRKYLSVAAVIILVLLIVPLATQDVYSWNLFKFFEISNENDKKVISQSTSSLDETAIDTSYAERRSTLDDANKIIEFDFRELPYELDEVIVFDRQKVILKYVTEKGNIVFTQKLEGIETGNTMSIIEDSEIETFTKNGIEYNYINIQNKIIKIIWNSNGIGSILEVKYYIDIDEVKNLIDSIE